MCVPSCSVYDNATLARSLTSISQYVSRLSCSLATRKADKSSRPSREQWRVVDVASNVLLRILVGQSNVQSALIVQKRLGEDLEGRILGSLGGSLGVLLGGS